MGIRQRKLDHLRICVEKPVQFREKRAGFERFDFVHNALPEISLDEVDTSLNLLGKKLSAPVVVAAITGGAKEGGELNKRIARACQKFNLGMGVGSQRAALEDPSLAYTYRVRDVAPDILLFGNLGLVQFCKGYRPERAQEAVDMIDADAMCIHLNAAQEAAQQEGETNFKGGVAILKQICQKVRVPVLAKECGSGISKAVGEKLVRAGVKGIDVGGAGGTSWVGVEYYRNPSHLASVFWDWGIPTVDSLVECRGLGVPLIATGGIRSGLDAAKALALGAAAVGLALPVVIAADGDKLEEYLQGFIRELKVAMFLTGSSNIRELKKAELIKV